MPDKDRMPRLKTQYKDNLNQVENLEKTNAIMNKKEVNSKEPEVMNNPKKNDFCY
ncbi:MAG: hypothetical protein LIP23_00315 [Planctomycetes bacterium]|nr:hypothetical protein [Planctomycetota bacterium]